MASNMQDSERQDLNTQWVPLRDGEATRASRTRLSRIAKGSLMVMGLLGLAAVAVYMSSPQQPSEGPAPMDEVATPSQIARATSVSAFNELLANTAVTDAQAMYDAMSLHQLELLYKDFLATIGSEAPDASNTPDRLEIFKNNVLTIMKQNAAEYARNPVANRATFGITVHADFTEEEFQTTRLNLKATDLAAYQASKNFTNSVKPLDLGSCAVETGGTCRWRRCDASRGATCYEGKCICTDGACAEDGKCVRPGHCKISTGGTCRYGSCNGWRNAKCVQGSCVCPLGTCAEGGKCVRAPTPKPDPNGITCSQSEDTAVRNQGHCGDCWAFSTAQQLRWMAKKKFGQDPGTMSVQYLVDCMPENMNHHCNGGVKGCCGGLPIRADQWLERSGGLPTQAQYGPLKSDTHPTVPYPCHRSAKKVRPIGAEMYRTEKDIANAFCSKGTVSLAVAASGLQHYTGGVMNVQGCPATQINHAILYTGVDTTFDNGNPVHIVLNSWGTSWGVSGTAPYGKGGQNGHALLRFGENVCNIEALATSPKDIEMVG